MHFLGSKWNTKLPAYRAKTLGLVLGVLCCAEQRDPDIETAFTWELNLLVKFPPDIAADPGRDDEGEEEEDGEDDDRHHQPGESQGAGPWLLALHSFPRSEQGVGVPALCSYYNYWQGHTDILSQISVITFNSTQSPAPKTLPSPSLLLSLFLDNVNLVTIVIQTGYIILHSHHSPSNSLKIPSKLIKSLAEREWEDKLIYLDVLWFSSPSSPLGWGEFC